MKSVNSLAHLIPRALASSDCVHTESVVAEGGSGGLSEGDLVWGAARGFPAWPGKLVGPVTDKDKVTVRWFGGDRALTEVPLQSLKTLSEGLEAHHRARKKFRKSRKLNSQLENAIQEAMLELDRMTEQQQQSSPVPTSAAAVSSESTGRLRRSAHR
ncbi:Methyl-CpG-binding domain protein 5 [Blattella germanica]|nr:Methyl-CpG-binding domain protein 5 [Blattella germanica]